MTRRTSLSNSRVSSSTRRDATEEPFVPSAEPKEWPADTEEEKTEDSMETEEDSRSPLPILDMATELVINEKEENLFVY